MGIQLNRFGPSSVVEYKKEGPPLKFITKSCDLPLPHTHMHLKKKFTSNLPFCPKPVVTWSSDSIRTYNMFMYFVYVSLERNIFSSFLYFYHHSLLHLTLGHLQSHFQMLKVFHPHWTLYHLLTVNQSPNYHLRSACMNCNVSQKHFSKFADKSAG